MWKIVFVILIVAAQTLCGPIENGTKTAFQRIIDDAWREKCKIFSRQTIDIERHNQIYMDFEKCTKTAIDKHELLLDVKSIFHNLDLNNMEDYDLSVKSIFHNLNNMEEFNLSESQKNDLVTVSRKYCPKVNALLCCIGVLVPIYRQCFNGFELEGQRVERNIFRGISNFFCKNKSDAVKRFIDGKVIECAMLKRDEILECYHDYERSLLNVNETFSIFMLPKRDNLCRSTESLGRCLVPLFNQCALSQTAGDMVTSLFEEVLEKASCSDHNRTIFDRLNYVVFVNELFHIHYYLQNCS